MTTEKKTKVLCCPDTHGDFEATTQCINRFLKKEFDYLVFLGDEVDHWTRKDGDMMRNVNIMIPIKKMFPDRVILLHSNHTYPYFLEDPEEYRCSGFRQTLYPALHALIFPERRLWQYAFGIKNHLFTHAGVSLNWYLANYKTLLSTAKRMGIETITAQNLWLILEGVGQTSNAPILHTVGAKRGGMDSDHGGPLWADKEELLNSPLVGYAQIVGHNNVNHITRIYPHKKRSESTSITFTDCLHAKTQFLELEI